MLRKSAPCDKLFLLKGMRCTLRQKAIVDAAALLPACGTYNTGSSTPETMRNPGTDDLCFLRQKRGNDAAALLPVEDRDNICSTAQDKVHSPCSDDMQIITTNICSTVQDKVHSQITNGTLETS